jgi:thiamine-monophosphate kinase
MSAREDEFALIARLFAPFAAALPDASLGLTDDVALISADRMVTIDTIVEGVHFRCEDPIDSVAQKLVRVNVSDIVAKGGRPEAALLALTWPRARPRTDLEHFALALGHDLQHYGASLIGGDTTSTDGPLTASLVLFGRPGPCGPVLRRTARVGDIVCVTGSIGDAGLGLRILEGLETVGEPSALVARYRRPEPRIGWADAVARLAHAAIDVSDGLWADAGHIAVTSGLALAIDATAIPLSGAAAAWAEASGDALAARVRLAGFGDDYEILFTAAPQAEAAIHAAVHAAGAPVCVIGRCLAGPPGAVIARAPDGTRIDLPSRGWSHL